MTGSLELRLVAGNELTKCLRFQSNSPQLWNDAEKLLLQLELWCCGRVIAVVWKVLKSWHLFLIANRLGSFKPPPTKVSDKGMKNQ